MTYTSIPYQTYKNIPLATYGFMGVALFVLAAVSIAEAGEGIASDLSLTSQLPAIFPPSDVSAETNENADYFSSTVEEQPTETQEYTGGNNEKKKKHKKTRGHKKHRAQSKTHKHKK